jgi:hypothetical protein
METRQMVTKRPVLVGFAGAVLALAQLAGCSSCTKEESHPVSAEPAAPAVSTGVRSLSNPKPIHKKFLNLRQGEAGAADASTD